MFVADWAFRVCDLHEFSGLALPDKRGIGGRDHHVGIDEKCLEGAQGIDHPSTLLDDLLIGALSFDVPLPGIFECVNLRTTEAVP
jgi:hypothetical protein